MIRFGLSAIALLCVYGVIRMFWYPGAYYEISGAAKQLWILVSIVIVVGPVLSTVIFRPGKKGLAMDIVILAAIELAALAAAMTLLYLRQPYFSVFAVDRFEAVSRQEVVDLELGIRLVGERPAREPRLVYAKLPDDPERLGELIKETVLMGMPDIDRRPEFWLPYPSGIADVKAAAIPLASLAAVGDGRYQAIAARLESSGIQEESVRFLPLRGRAGDATIIMDADTGYPVTTVVVDPWISASEDGEPAGDVEQAHE